MIIQMPSKVMIVFGTRPEAIKMAPICLLLKKNKNFKPIICTTSQHVSMLNQVLDIFSIKPNINLKIMKKNQDLFDININVLNEITGEKVYYLYHSHSALQSEQSKIDNNWHLYSQYIENEPPLPTIFLFDNGLISSILL